MFLRLLALNRLANIIITIIFKPIVPKLSHLQCPPIIWIPVAISHRGLQGYVKSKSCLTRGRTELAMALLQSSFLGLGEKLLTCASPSAWTACSYEPTVQRQHSDNLTCQLEIDDRGQYSFCVLFCRRQGSFWKHLVSPQKHTCCQDLCVCACVFVKDMLWRPQSDLSKNLTQLVAI